MTNKQKIELLFFSAHYNNEINKICNKNLWWKEMGLLTEERILKNNEELYLNIMRKNNIDDIIAKNEQDND